jgi:hypothetical protein
LVHAALAIRFYAPNEASVRIETTATGEEEQRAEILLFCFYAAHWIDQLNRRHRGDGINPGVDLALTLRVSEREELLMDPLVWSLEEKEPLVRLLPDTGHAAKQLSAELRYSDADPATFTTSTSGFGLLGRRLRGLGQYGEQSVLALQRHLLVQRQDDHPYTIRLWWAGHELGAEAVQHGVRPIESAVKAADRGWAAVTRIGSVRREMP